MIKIFGAIALAAVIGFAMTSCDLFTEADITWTLSQEGGADGSGGGEPTTSTTALKLTFNKEVDLISDEIVVSGTIGTANLDSLSGYGKVWTIPIDVTSTGNAIVTINKEGVEKGSRTVKVFKQGSSETPGSTSDKTLTINGLGKFVNDTYLMLGLYETKSSEYGDGAKAYGGGEIKNGSAIIELFHGVNNETVPWSGTGSFYVYIAIFEEDGDDFKEFEYVSKDQVTFNSANTNIDLTNFDELISTPNEVTLSGTFSYVPSGMSGSISIYYDGIDPHCLLGSVNFTSNSKTWTIKADAPPVGSEIIFALYIIGDYSAYGLQNLSIFYEGETIISNIDIDFGTSIVGEIKGTIIFTDVPTPVPQVYIDVWGENWHSQFSEIPEIKNGSVDWVIPVYAADRFVSEEDCYFYLYVVPNGSEFNEGYEIEITSSQIIEHFFSEYDLGNVSLAVNNNDNELFTNYTDFSIQVSNYSDMDLIAFKDSLSSANLIGGIPAASISHGLQRNTALFPDQPSHFQMVFITKEQYNQNKNNLNNLNNQIITRIYVFWNGITGDNTKVYEISGKLGGIHRIQISNTTNYDVELRVDGITGPILAYVPSGITLNYINVISGDFFIFPVFHRHNALRDIIEIVVPALDGRAFSYLLSFTGAVSQTLMIDLNQALALANFPNMGAAVVKIVNNSSTGIQLFRGQVLLTTPGGIGVINAGAQQEYIVEMPSVGNYYAPSIYVNWNIMQAGLFIDIKSTEGGSSYMIETDKMYTIIVSGSAADSTLKAVIELREGEPNGPTAFVFTPQSFQ